ncbi:hypothetical protein [Salinicoccus sp. CNSTN-B1]
MLEVTDRAVDWMKDEMDPDEGQGVNVYVRYGGDTQLKQGFSPALTVDQIPPTVKYSNTKGLKSSSRKPISVF